LVVNNFIATSSQWKSWYTARILCFRKFQKKLYPFNRREDSYLRKTM